MTVRELLLQATSLLKDVGIPSPRLDSEILLMHAWKVDKTALITRADEHVPDATVKLFWSLHTRRQQREPIAYIVGEKEFWSRPFHVDSRVLIPRPETEHLIEALLKEFPNRNGYYRFCDIGTGSGCIACTVACEFPHAEIVATDISDDALRVAKANADRLGVADRITFKNSDMFTSFEPDIPAFDAVLSNPPYVSRNEMRSLEPELAFEPRSALTDEADGHYYLTILFNECHQWLKPQGFLIVETGTCGLPSHSPHLTQLYHYHDLAGISRGAVYRTEPS